VGSPVAGQDMFQTGSNKKRSTAVETITAGFDQKFTKGTQLGKKWLAGW